MADISKFIDNCGQIANNLLNITQRSPIYIFSHFDADGISAASIMIAALSRAGLTFQLRVIERLEYHFLQQLNNTLPVKSTVIFLDLGTGVIEAFNKWKSSFNVFIFDHHTPPQTKIKLPKNICILNPHYYSLDGATELSGAGVTYFIAININPQNKDLAPLAIIGALGDRQDQGENSSLTGMNEFIVQDAIELGLVSNKISVWFYDRTRSIIEVLKRSNFLNFTNELEIRTFLDILKISTSKNQDQRNFYDLNEDECRKLASELIIQYGVDTSDLYKHDFLLIHEATDFLKDARVFASKLNACGRSSRPDIGISLCLGDRQTAIRDLKLIEQEYSKSIATGLNWALTEGNLTELSSIYVLDGRKVINERIIGTIISMISSNRNISPKPILGCAVNSSGKIKISMRTSNFKKGQIDLSELLKKAIQELDPGSEVGGHQAAAGAIISESFLQNFITRINQLVLEGSQ